MYTRKGPKTKKARGRHLKDKNGNVLSLDKSVWLRLRATQYGPHFDLAGGNRRARKQMLLYIKKWGIANVLNYSLSQEITVHRRVTIRKGL